MENIKGLNDCQKFPEIAPSSLDWLKRFRPIIKSGSRRTGELCPNWPKWSIPAQKIDIDNHTRFRYQVRCGCPLIDASISEAAADTPSNCRNS